jgi:fimbrial chaperone protein
MSMKRNLPFLAIAALGLVLSQAESALASAFKVTPIQVFLSPEKKSELLTLTNESEQPLRFQITARKWSQTPEGEIALAETNDVVFFPTLLTLGVGEERNVRVGLTAEIGDTEKTYRLFFEELPALDPPEGGGAVVQVLTKMGIPIFATPPKARSKPILEEETLSGGIVRFRVANQGNMHMTLRSVRVTAYGPGGEVLMDRQREGWYVLPATPRNFDFELPPEVCDRAEKIGIRAWTDAEGAPGGLVLEKQIVPSETACVAK